MKLLTIGASAAVTGFLNSLALTLFNVPINVVVLAAAGCLLSYAYEGNPEHTPKKKLYFSILANTFTATAAVSVVPHFLGWGWYSDSMQGSVAFLFALAARFAVPFFFKMLPEIIRRWFRIGEYKDVPEKNDVTGYSEYERYERLPEDFK